MRALPRFPTTRLARSRGLWVVVAVTLAVVGAVSGETWSERTGTAQLLAVSTERLELYAGMLESEVARYAQLPRVVAIDPEATHVLDAPDDTATRERASERLARIAARSGVRALWVVDPQGRRLARSESPVARASSDDKDDPALGEDRLARELALGTPGFFAIDPATGRTDYVVVHPVQPQGRLRGYLVARIDLAPLEATWVDLGSRTRSERVLVLDDRQRVLLSSVPAWKLGQLDEATAPETGALEGTAHAAQADAIRTSPSLDAAGPRLRLSERHRLSAGAQIADLSVTGEDVPAWRCLAQDSLIPSLGVRLMALSDTADVWRFAHGAALGGGAAGAFIGLLWIYLRHRQGSLAQVARARDDLRRAHDELERQVAERTNQLQVANEQLQRQVAERLALQDELVQAGKLAVLGQMSAEISHEINQPLTALRALSRNTEQLLERGRHADVTTNLRSIGGLVARMERMARQLKSFARKGPSDPRPVRVIDAIDNVRVLLEPRLRGERVDLRVDVDYAMRVVCDGSRLEQVLVNLLGNAIDAMARRDVRRATISARIDGERCLLRVADTGGGMDDATLDRVFEPFFTTKPAGEGLGLGLVISQNIVHEFGGTLRVQRDTNGLVFEFDLPLER